VGKLQWAGFHHRSGAGGVLVGAIGWRTIRDKALVPPTMFKNCVFSACLGIAAAMMFGMYAMLFLTPLYLQSVRGSSALLAGIQLSPMSVAFLVVSQLSGGFANIWPANPDDCRYGDDGSWSLRACLYGCR
jgi:hypothetical protein